MDDPVTDEALEEATEDKIEEKPALKRRLADLAGSIDWSLVVLAAVIAVYIALFATLSLHRYLNYRHSGLDIAIFDQTIWKLSRFSGPTSTIRGMSLFGDHMAPILFFLVPVYWLGGNATALLVIQTVALALGALPIYLLARDKLESRWIPVALASAYLLFPAMQHFNLFDFHPEALAVCFLLFAFLAIDRGRNVWFIVLCAAAAFCKEDMALAVAVLGILVYFKYNKKVGGAVAAGSAVYFLASILVLIPAFAPAGYQYGGRLTQFGDSTLGAVKNMIVHPVHTFNVLATRENLRYLFDLFIPVGFLCFLAPEYLLPAVPALLVNLISDFQPQHTIFYQYTAAIIPFIFIALVFSLKRIKSWLRGAVHPKLVMGTLAMVILACSVAGNFYFSPSPLSEEWNALKYGSDTHTRALAEATGEIPEDASVSSQVYVLPHLSERNDLYMFPQPFIDYVDEEYLEKLDEDELKFMFPGGIYMRFTEKENLENYPVPDVDYIVIDRSIDSWPLTREQYDEVVDRLLETGRFSRYFDDKGILILKKREKTGNDANTTLSDIRETPGRISCEHLRLPELLRSGGCR
ncbi:MAG: DUF2079 domain-containing protein [Actinobacteria bacterium]|nr:DUF2079 domain-containing protein [Actinomycetota bacterium]